MCEHSNVLSREEIEATAARLGILMWECPRENGRLILRPAIFFESYWPSVILAQLKGLESLEDPALLGVTKADENQAMQALKKVYEASKDAFIKSLKPPNSF